MKNVIRFITIFSITAAGMFILYLISHFISGLLLTAIHLPGILESYESSGSAAGTGSVPGAWWAQPFFIFAIIASLMVAWYAMKKPVKTVRAG